MDIHRVMLDRSGRSYFGYDVQSMFFLSQCVPHHVSTAGDDSGIGAGIIHGSLVPMDTAVRTARFPPPQNYAEEKFWS
jgi:hypothetical protein